jgi:hypothetical protein
MSFSIWMKRRRGRMYDVGLDEIVFKRGLGDIRLVQLEADS